MYWETIQYYFKNPFNKFEMEDPTITHFEDNDTCWDSLTVYLKINTIDNTIKNWSWSWDTAIITTALASLLGEIIIWEKLENVLSWDYDFMQEQLWEPVSDRRKKASVLALLTTRNAIHNYLNDGVEDDFPDLIQN